jgi:hypothetical protein
MGKESVVTEVLSKDLFSVVVRALNVEAVVMDSNPGMNKESLSKALNRGLANP